MPANRDNHSPLLRGLLRFDWLLPALVLLATAYGLAVLRGTTSGALGLEGYFQRQLSWFFVSLGVFLIALAVPYRWLLFFAWPFYLFSIGLLGLLLAANELDLGFLKGITSNNAASWFRLHVAGRTLTFQPSEFAKIATVAVLAHLLYLRGDRPLGLRGCILPLLLTALPVGIVFFQPDFGTAAIFLPIPLAICFAAGLRWRIVLIGGALGLLIAVSGIVYLTTADSVPGLRQYQLDRIRVFLKPLTSPLSRPGIEDILYSPPAASEEGEADAFQQANEWNIEQAEIALGSGGLRGLGLGRGTQGPGRWLPEAHTDFIFSSLGEQLGLSGCLALFILYLAILWRMVQIALANPDPFGRYLIVGFCAIFMTHVFMNVGMTIRILPVTGIPLPFMSYGGSFLAANYLIFGLAANISLRRPDDA